MKKLYVCLLAFLGICISCYDDKGNYDYQVLNQTEVTGIDSIYYCALLSQLKISPQINSADASREYSYLWLCYQDTKDGIDTLSQEKDLAYELTMDPAIYSLVFSYQDTQTGVTKYVSSKLVVESEYSRGWYVMKEKDGNTDLDFFSSTFEAEDLMLKISGEAAQGKPKCFGLIDSYNWLNEETGELEQWNKCFAILAEQDLKIVRVSDLKTLGDFNSLFYEPMDICKPGKWFGWDGANAFINNGKVFTVNTRLGVLGSAKFAYAKEGDYHLVDVVTKKSQLSPLLFDEKSYRHELEIKEAYVVCMAARFAPAKNWDMFLNVAEKVYAVRKDIVFLAIGDGPLLDTYRKVCAQRKIFNIKFLGHRSDVENLIRLSHVSLLFTNNQVHAEGVSNTIMETMAAKRPIIATAGGGTAEIVEDGENGYIIEPNDVEKAIHILFYLINHPEERKKISEAAYETIHSKFLLQDKTQEYINLYKTLLS